MLAAPMNIEEYGISTRSWPGAAKMARHGVVACQEWFRRGGYQLARDPGQISALT